MLLGGDLVFLIRVILASFVVLFVPVFGFVVRRKWRRSAAREEEIKRLLVLASEETARAELEAISEYGFGGEFGYREAEVEPEPEVEVKEEVVEEEEVLAEIEVPVTESSNAHRRLQNQCEVCFSLTASRCARCKAVYYCSGKCQIMHWRKGHKDECHQFGASDQNNDTGDLPYPNTSIPLENGSCKRNIEVEGWHPVKPVQKHDKESKFTHSNLESLDSNDDIEVTQPKDGRGPYSNLKHVAHNVSDEMSGGTSISKSAVHVSATCVNNSNLASRNRFVDVVPDKINKIYAPEKRIKSVFPEDSCLSSSVDKAATSVTHNLVEPSPLDMGSLCGSSSSSSSSLSSDGCDESSFSEPSTPSSGFWEGVNNFSRRRIDNLDDTAHSGFDETVDVDVLDSQFSPGSSQYTGKLLPAMNVPVSHAEKIKSGDICPSISAFKKPNDVVASSIKINKDCLKSQTLSSMSEKTGPADVDDVIGKKLLALEKVKEHEVDKDANANTNPPLSCDESTSQVASKSRTFREPKPMEVKSLLPKASEVHLSSFSAKQTVENVQSVKSDCIQALAACSSERNVGISPKVSVWKVVDQLKASKLARLKPLGNGSECAGRYTDKGLFQYELFVKLYNWNKVDLLPCGLMNCGNSCYANVVLQCLAFTPPLTAYFLQGLHSRACKKKDWCFTCEFEGLVLKAKEGHSPISPSRIISQLQNIGSHLGNGREEDAHEFLRYVIEAMQSVCLKHGATVASSSLEETTLIGLTFGGYLRSKIECMKCGGKSERQEKMMDLTVEIDGDIGTLEEALRQFTRSETLDGENKYQCGRCKSFEKARKKLRVLEAPNVLTIALKRFQSGKFGKLNKTIKFPEILDMAPYMSGTSDKSPVYRLYGVVVHLDIMNAAFSGHYVCYVKNTQNRWFKIDDTMVKPVELEKVLAKGAYMLLYARCSPRAPRLVRSLINARDPRKAKDVECKPREPSQHLRNSSLSDSSSSQSCNEPLASIRANIQPIRKILEEDSSSDNSSSLFSVAKSCSTDSSTRDSTSTDDYFDQIFGDMGAYWNSPWRNSSDSESLSSASSSSPVYLRRSSPADLPHDASDYLEANVRRTDAAESAVFGRSMHLGGRQTEAAEGIGSLPFLCPDSTKHRRKIGSSSSCRESGSSKLGWVNSLDNWRSSVPFRRSTRGRPD